MIPIEIFLKYNLWVLVCKQINPCSKIWTEDTKSISASVRSALRCVVATIEHLWTEIGIPSLMPRQHQRHANGLIYPEAGNQLCFLLPPLCISTSLGNGCYAWDQTLPIPSVATSLSPYFNHQSYNTWMQQVAFIYVEMLLKSPRKLFSEMDDYWY